MRLFKHTAWCILVSLYAYGITERMLDYQRQGFSQYELSVLTVPLFCLFLTIIIRPN